MVNASMVFALDHDDASMLKTALSGWSPTESRP